MLDTFDIFAGPRIDFDNIAFVHEDWSLEFSARF
eukprot:COSAG01_NODE_111_length_25761_cov_2190.280493_1_plen_33_part_10